MVTREDLLKIEDWLSKRAVKDTDLPKALPVTGDELVPVIQEGKNRITSIKDLVERVSYVKPEDFFNVSAYAKKAFLTLEEAIALVPFEKRKLGLVITFRNERGNWQIYQFNGCSTNQWDSAGEWDSIIRNAIVDMVYHPDEEDITYVQDGNRKLLKFKNRYYNPDEFIGQGMVILRRNYVGSEACAIDDEDHLLNILTQDMINKPNTVYIIEYDFDLDGKAISIPENCVLWFQGGTINNGSIYLNDTAILGAFEFADTGNCNLFGNFNTGQIMTFANDSYKRKEGGYFNPFAFSMSGEKEESFVPGAVNGKAYADSSRQELRWWNGEEWVLILDITDYNEIKSIINDLIDKHNKEISAVFQYFLDRCKAIEARLTTLEEWRSEVVDPTIQDHETRITNNETSIVNINKEINNINVEISDIVGDITNINQSIENITETITNIDTVILENINQYITDNTVGTKSIKVNGRQYDMDSNGIITLPDYPTSIDGGNAGTADRVNHKLFFTGAINEEYDGSKEVTVNITPESIGAATKQPEGFDESDAAEIDFSGLMVAMYYEGRGKKSINDIVIPGNYRIQDCIDLPPDSTDYGQLLVLRGSKNSDTITHIYFNWSFGTAYYRSGNFNEEGEYYYKKVPWRKFITNYDDLSGGTGGSFSGGNADSADKVNHKLIFKGSENKEYDGSKEVTITIPSSTGSTDGGTADKVANKLKFTGAVEAEYDGSKEVTVNIPAGGGTSSDESLGSKDSPVILLQLDASIPSGLFGVRRKHSKVIFDEAAYSDVFWGWNNSPDATMQSPEGNVITSYDPTKPVSFWIKFELRAANYFAYISEVRCERMFEADDVIDNNVAYPMSLAHTRLKSTDDYSKKPVIYFQIAWNKGGAIKELVNAGDIANSQREHSRRRFLITVYGTIK